MTRKHFVALAERIAKISARKAREEAARAVADVCETENPDFDRARFVAACNA